jgi:tRNA(Ile)-lysidine synthase
MPEPVISTSPDSPTAQLLSELGRFILEYKLLGTSDRVLCMVSGGADSTSMLELLYSLSLGAGPDSLKGVSLGVCHVNYGLRGNASEEDEAFVWRLGENLGVQVHSIRAPEPPATNFQAWAREFRYQAARNLCRWQGYTRIATGHNLDDRVETFIYRMITYSGRRSLAVMPPRAGKVVRPLLFMTAARIREFCQTAGISYREDESNHDARYRRNRIRQEVMPGLAGIRPDFLDRIDDTISLLEDEERVLAALTAEAADEVLLDNDGQPGLSAAGLSLLDRALARLVVRSWLERQSQDIRISRRVLDSVVDMCSESHGTQTITLAAGLKLERRYDKLFVSSPGSATTEPVPRPVELPVPGTVDFAGYEIESEAVEGGDTMPVDRLHVRVDAARLSLPLVVRSWHEGDRMRPLGMEGTKTLQDLFVDEKVPRGDRGSVPVIVSGGEIVWVCGLRMSEDFKVLPGSKRIIEIRAARRDLEDEI